MFQDLFKKLMTMTAIQEACTNTDPLSDISQMRSIESVWIGGQPIELSPAPPFPG